MYDLAKKIGHLGWSIRIVWIVYVYNLIMYESDNTIPSNK